MNVEQIIVDELREVGAAIRPPVAPDPALLVREAEQARVRTLVRSGASVVLAAAVVLGIVLLGVHLHDPKAAPAPTPQPTGFPTGAPVQAYVDETGQLHVDGVVEAGSSWVDSPLRFGDVTVAHSDAAGDRVTLFVGSQKVATLPRLFPYGEPELSPDHRTVAWAEPRDGSGFIVVARLSAAGLHELGRLKVPTLALDNDNEGHESVLRLADDGTVTYGGLLGGHAWKPGGQPRDVTLPENDTRLPGFPGEAEATLVRNPSGSWAAWLSGEIDPGPGGVVEFRAVGFQRPGEPDSRVVIDMPTAETHLQTLAWQDDTHLLLTVGDGESSYHVLRCDIGTRRCEHAPMPVAP